MAGFVQIIQYKTSNFDDMQKLADKFREQTEGRRTVARVMVCKDRDNADQFMTIAEFPSYEAAMKKYREDAAKAKEEGKPAPTAPRINAPMAPAVLSMNPTRAPTTRINAGASSEISVLVRARMWRSSISATFSSISSSLPVSSPTLII